MWVNCFINFIKQLKNQIKMRRTNLSPEREQELINIYSEFLPAERVQVVNFSNCKEAEDCDDGYDENNIVLFQWENEI